MDLEQFKVLKQFLDVSELFIETSDIKYYEYHPVGFADMIANLDNPCSIKDVINVVNQFVEAEIKNLEEERK
jgi:hypothetical protein